MIYNDTIVALATASGAGAVAIIRLSGKDAITIADTSFKSVKSQKSLSNQKTHTIHLGHIMDNNRTIDEVLVSVFKNPNSYTGENVVEISCHGSIYIQQEIIQLFLRKGCRMANPGEFTLRAFLNAKLDFAEEDVEFADRKQFKELIERITFVLKRLIDSFAVGNVIKNGIPVAIVGEPNVGKSTLLNALLNEERAIVSDIAGTTRDTIEDELVIDGIGFRFIDTAGIRETKDVVESIGIKKTFEKMEQAQVVVLLFSADFLLKNLKLKVKDLKLK